MWIRWFAAILACCPVVGTACEWTDRDKCRDEVEQLVAYRTAAIEYAFGNVFGTLPKEIAIRFVGADDEQYKKFSGRVAYDTAEHVFVVPQRFINARTPNPMRWAGAYWPYYGDRRYQGLFPLIGEIDNALWGAVLQENARVNGLSWPHSECASIDLSKRLPCEMLVAGIAALLTERQAPMFNSNVIERIWPEQFSRFEQSSWRSDRDYADVRHYGGIMLLQPLFSEFGAASALRYIAQTPFQVEGDNMRASALRYQERARQVLQSRPRRTSVTQESDNNAEQLPLPGNGDRRVIAFGSREGA